VRYPAREQTVFFEDLVDGSDIERQRQNERNDDNDPRRREPDLSVAIPEAKHGPSSLPCTLLVDR
jgi:hypothetical protein